jgi:hypothetical protein
VSPASDGQDRPLDPAQLRACPPPRRADLLRKALRGGHVDPRATARDLSAWIDLFDDHDDPGLLVLLLELLRSVEDPRVVEVARGVTGHRGDGVRLESLRLLLDRRPGETSSLVAHHRDDESLEVRMLLAERLYELDRTAGIDFVFEILEAERDGPREMHALERGTRFLVEDVGGREVVTRLRRILPRFEDEEGA